MGLGWARGSRVCVAWFDDGEEGAAVGQDAAGTDTETLLRRLEECREKARGGARLQREEVEYLAVEIAAKRWIEERGSAAEEWAEAVEGHGFLFFGAPDRELKSYMRTLKSALARAHDATPWPEWAVKAQAEGWKAPKGWKP